MSNGKIYFATTNEKKKQKYRKSGVLCSADFSMQMNDKSCWIQYLDINLGTMLYVALNRTRYWARILS